MRIVVPDMNTIIFTFEGGLYPLLGVLLFCAGTMLGIPHGLAKRSGDTKRTELWRVAHLSTCVGGISLIALSVALERLFGASATYISCETCNSMLTGWARG